MNEEYETILISIACACWVLLKIMFYILIMLSMLKYLEA